MEYRDLPAVVDAEAALAPGAPQLHADIPGNLAFDYEYGDERRPRRPLRARGVRHAPRGSIRRESPGRRWSQGLRLAALRCGERHLRRVRAVAGLVDDAAELRGHYWHARRAYPHPRARRRRRLRHPLAGLSRYCALMLAAKRLGKPVKWVGSRFETIVGRSSWARRRARWRGSRWTAMAAFSGCACIWMVNMRDVPLRSPARSLTARPGGRTRSTCIASRRFTGGISSCSPTPRPQPRTAAPAAECFIPRRAPGRRGGARARHRPRRDPAAQSHPARSLPYKTPSARPTTAATRRASSRKLWSARRGQLSRNETSISLHNGKLRGIGCAVFCEPSGAGAAPKKRR